MSEKMQTVLSTARIVREHPDLRYNADAQCMEPFVLVLTVQGGDLYAFALTDKFARSLQAGLGEVIQALETLKDYDVNAVDEGEG